MEFDTSSINLFNEQGTNVIKRENNILSCTNFGNLPPES